MQINIKKEARSCRRADSEDPVKKAQDYRKVGIALLFAAGALLAWTSAVQTYNQPVGMFNAGDRMVRLTMAQVNQYAAFFSDANLHNWPPEPLASAALWQRTCHRFAFITALVCGFFSVFCFGLQIEELRQRNLGGEPKPEAQSDLNPPGR